MHSYKRLTGEPCYTVKGLNGKERDVTIKDMRELDCLPSVTEVNKAVIRNDFLDQWLREELLEWAAFNPREPDESLEDYKQRGLAEGGMAGNKAKNFGTLFHEFAENYTGTMPEELPLEIFGFTDVYAAWFHENVEEVVAAELPMACIPFGVGGKLDSLIRHKKHGLCVMDIKTQKVKTVTPKTKPAYKKISYYDSWIQQLALYSAMYDITTVDNPEEWAQMMIEEGMPVTAPRCVSVVVDSQKPGFLEEKLWTPEETDGGLQLALNCCKVWQLIKKYKPKGSIL